MYNISVFQMFCELFTAGYRPALAHAIPFNKAQYLAKAKIIVTQYQEE